MKKIITLLLISIVLISQATSSATTYHVGFYSDFEPVSYAKNKDPASSDFPLAQGYEIDLLKAIEQIPGSNINFVFHPEKIWNDLWLQPYLNPRIDIAAGGITKEERRLLGHEGRQVVVPTHKTVTFKQSLLMSSENAQHFSTHDDLTCAVVVGVVAGTTGEYRYLAQAGIIDNVDGGRIKKGVSVVLEDKKHLTSDGTLSIYDPKIKSRAWLVPSDCTLPLTKYFVAENTMIPALKEGSIDAIARGYIGNKRVADRSNGKFVVTAVYSLECPKQQSINCAKKEEAAFFLRADDARLLETLNQYIDYLTDNGKIDYDEWEANPRVFLERAKKYRKSP